MPPVSRLPLTLNIQVGKKLSDKSKDEIMTELVKIFKDIRAVQTCYDTVRVTFRSPELFQAAKAQSGVHVFGMWCPILGGGPPVTVVNLFDYPYEEEDVKIEDVLCAFGEVKRIRHQSYVSCADIFTGTRLVSLVLNSGCTLPRYITIDGFNCRMWYRGQPLICNLCALQGHKSANCPNKDRCRRCGETGHFARACRNPWSSLPSGDGGDARPGEEPVSVPVVQVPAPASGSQSGEAGSQGPSQASSLEGLVVGEVPASASGVGSQGLVSEGSLIEEFSSPSLPPESSEPIDSFPESQSILRGIDQGDPSASDGDPGTVAELIDDHSSNLSMENIGDAENSLNNMDQSGPSRKRCLEESEAEVTPPGASRSRARKVRSFSTSAAAAGVEAAKSGVVSSDAPRKPKGSPIRSALGSFLPRRRPAPAPNLKASRGAHTALPGPVSDKPSSRSKTKPKS